MVMVRGVRSASDIRYDRDLRSAAYSWRSPKAASRGCIATTAMWLCRLATARPAAAALPSIPTASSAFARMATSPLLIDPPLVGHK